MNQAIASPDATPADAAIEAAADEIRAVLRRATRTTTEAMLAALVAAATFSLDDHDCNKRAALKMEVAAKSIVRGVREGGIARRKLHS